MKAVKVVFVSAAALCIVGASAAAEARGARSHGAPAHVGLASGAPVVSHRSHSLATHRHIGAHPRHFGAHPRHFAVPRAHVVPRRTTFVGVHFGVPLLVPPVVYYSPPLIAAAPVYAPPVYVERHAEVPDATAYWHYCPDSQAYYPHVQQCPSPWERVIPHAPPPPSAAP
jgi:hypothetical protein